MLRDDFSELLDCDTLRIAERLVIADALITAGRFGKRSLAGVTTRLAKRAGSAHCDGVSENRFEETVALNSLGVQSVGLRFLSHVTRHLVSMISSAEAGKKEETRHTYKCGMLVLFETWDSTGLSGRKTSRGGIVSRIWLHAATQWGAQDAPTANRDWIGRSKKTLQTIQARIVWSR